MIRTYQWVFTGVYAAVLVSYFFSEVSGDFKRRAINKIALAAMFFVWAIAELSARGGLEDPLYCLLAAAFTLAFVGDLVFLWSFNGGGAFFYAANLLLFGFELWVAARLDIAFGALWWAIPAFAVLFGVAVVAARRGVLPLGAARKKYLAYLAGVTAHGALGLALAATGRPALMLFGGGMALFMASDYLLFAYSFRWDRNAVLISSSAAYFGAMAVAVLSIPQFLP